MCVSVCVQYRSYALCGVVKRKTPDIQLSHHIQDVSFLRAYGVFDVTAVYCQDASLFIPTHFNLHTHTHTKLISLVCKV